MMRVMRHTDLLNSVVSELERRVGELRRIASDAGIPYDTVLRIKNREGDPGYSKVRRLAEHFGLIDTKRRPSKQEAV